MLLSLREGSLRDRRTCSTDCWLQTAIYIYCGGLTRKEEQGILGELEGEFSRGRAGEGLPWDTGNKGDQGLLLRKD